MKNKSFLLILGVFALIVIGALTAYSYFEKSQVDDELKQVESTLANLENDVLKFENQNLVETIAAKETLDELSLDSVEWSQVIKEIRKTIPKNSRGLPVLDVVSYSGSGGNEISLSVATLDDAEPYFNVADFIESFNENEEFVDNFVPSVAIGIDPEGQEILTFTFNTKYVEKSEEFEAPVLR